MLDADTVRRIARLARIRVNEAEVVQMQGELNGILALIDQLNEVDVTGVEPLAGGALMAMRMRDDRVTDGDLCDAVLANAPDRDGPFYAVPKVVE